MTSHPKTSRSVFVAQSHQLEIDTATVLTSHQQYWYPAWCSWPCGLVWFCNVLWTNPQLRKWFNWALMRTRDCWNLSGDFVKSIRVGCKLALRTCGHVCQDPVSLFHLGSFVDSLSDTVTTISCHCYTFFFPSLVFVLRQRQHANSIHVSKTILFGAILGIDIRAANRYSTLDCWCAFHLTLGIPQFIVISRMNIMIFLTVIQPFFATAGVVFPFSDTQFLSFYSSRWSADHNFVDVWSRLVAILRKLFDFDSFLICVTFVASSPHLLVEIYDLYVTWVQLSQTFLGVKDFFLAILGRWMTQNPTFQGWEDVHFMGLANPFQHVPLGRCGFHLCSMEATTSPRNESPLLVAFWMQGFTVEPASQRRDSMDLRNGQEPTWMV